VGKSFPPLKRAGNFHSAPLQKNPGKLVTKVYKWVYIIVQVLGTRNNQFHNQPMIIMKTLAFFRGAVGHFELILEKIKEK
jgi:hypothetical protein